MLFGMHSVRTEYTLYAKYTFTLSLNSLQDTKEGRNDIKLISCCLLLAIPERSTVIKVREALNERSPTKTNLNNSRGVHRFLTRGMCVTCLDYWLIWFTCTVVSFVTSLQFIMFVMQQERKLCILGLEAFVIMYTRHENDGCNAHCLPTVCRLYEMLTLVNR